MKNRFTGIFTALVTPFKDGEVDEASLRKLVHHQLENGINGFVVNGTTAESPCLKKSEKKKIFDVVKSESSGQVPIVLGTGSNNTSETAEATKEAQQWGADATLVVVPYYNKPPQRGLVAHFRAVAAASDLPLLLYNVPGRTITKLELEAIAELSKVKNIVGIKEASGDVAFGKNIIASCGPDFQLWSGDDSTCLDLMGIGACGVISVASHILPREFVDWSKAMLSGDVQSQNSAQKEIAKLQNLIAQLYVEANPIPVKTALHLMGILATADMRLPLVTLNAEHTENLKNQMIEAGLL